MKTVKQILFWLLSFTWGIVMTLVGVVVSLFCLLAGKTPEHFHHYITFRIGKNWGGFEMGPFFFTDETPSLYTKQHEAGHGIQNIMFGPLMPFVVSIPSAIRYWFRKQKTKKGKYTFCIVLMIILAAIGLTFLVPGAIFVEVWAIVIGALIVAYTICLSCWLFIKELPQYDDDANVSYYSIWFEGQASNLGQKYFPEENEKQ